MGSRLLDDDDEDRDPDDPDAPAVLPRKPKASALKKLAGDAPKASASLDDFITKANEGLLDVRSDATPLPTSSREKDLQAKVDELEKKLTAAETRAKQATEPVMPMAPPSRGWGGIVVAFALGCGAMFAVSTFVLDKHPEKTAATTPAPEATKAAAPDPAPAPAPTPTQVAQPTETAQPTEVAQPTPAPTPTPAPIPDKVAAKKQPGGAHHSGGTHETHAASTTNTQSPTPKPPDGAQNGSSDLYNPF